MAAPDISTLIDQLSAGPDRARAEAATCLESLGSAAVPALLEALGHADPQVRHRAVWALEEIDAPEAAPGLVGRLYDAHPKVRLAAVFALGRLATRHGSVAPRAVLGLRDSLLDYEPVIRQKAAQALGEIGRARPGVSERALWGLIESLRDDAALVRAAAATSLGQLADARASRALLTALDDDQAMVRLACLDALAEVRDISTIPALRAHLGTTPSRAERLALIDAMETVGGVRVRVSLRANQLHHMLKAWLARLVDVTEIRQPPKAVEHPPFREPNALHLVLLRGRRRRFWHSTPALLIRLFLSSFLIAIIAQLLLGFFSSVWWLY